MSNIEISKALAQAFGEIDNTIKNASNPHFKSNYTDLPAVLTTIREVYRKYELAVVQFPGEIKLREGKYFINITTTVIHSSGEMIGHTMEMRVNEDKNGKLTPHAVGSSITFGRRYALAAVAGISQQDDDGNAGSDGQDDTGVDGHIDIGAAIQAAQHVAALLALQPLVEATGNSDLVTMFKRRHKELRGK